MTSAQQSRLPEASTVKRPETVVLVHGTFAAPKTVGPSQWYEPGSDFVRALDDELAKLGSTARCWAHVADAKRGSASVFSWTGENHWLDRDEAAIHLAALLDDLLRRGWRCHIVAHSHGGNVTLEALRRMSVSTDPGYADAWGSGSIVTMGTPFLTPPSIPNPFFPESQIYDEDVGWKGRCQWYGTSLLFSTSLLSLIVLGLWLAGVDQRTLIAVRLSWLSILATVAVGLTLGSCILLARMIDAKLIGAWIPPNVKRLLVLTSEHDEAWQLLHGLLASPRSVATRVNSDRKKDLAISAKRLRRLLINTDAGAFPGRSYTLDLVGWSLVVLLLVVTTYRPATMGAHLSQIALGILGILTIGFTGIPLRTRAFIAVPYRIVRALGVVAMYGLSTLVAAIVRWLTMPVARGKAAGSDYLPTTKPLPSRTPRHVNSDFYELRMLNDEVMQRTLADRNVATGSALGDLLGVLGQHGIGSAQLDELLKGIAGNVSLCHAAYYAKAPYIVMIAAWLARTEAELLRIELEHDK